jgi:hypothetical protein
MQHEAEGECAQVGKGSESPAEVGALVVLEPIEFKQALENLGLNLGRVAGRIVGDAEHGLAIDGDGDCWCAHALTFRFRSLRRARMNSHAPVRVPGCQPRAIARSILRRPDELTSLAITALAAD